MLAKKTILSNQAWMVAPLNGHHERIVVNAQPARSQGAKLMLNIKPH